MKRRKKQAFGTKQPVLGFTLSIQLHRHPAPHTQHPKLKIFAMPNGELALLPACTLPQDSKSRTLAPRIFSSLKSQASSIQPEAF